MPFSDATAIQAQPLYIVEPIISDDLKLKFKAHLTLTAVKTAYPSVRLDVVIDGLTIFHTKRYICACYN